MKITFHLEKSFEVKPHKQPRTAEERAAAEAGTGTPTVPTRAAASSVPYDVQRATHDKEPSWVGKLMIKMKKSFCLKLEIQDRMYDAHQNEKKSRRCQKAIMTHLNLPVSDGSEGVITPKDEWISKIKWSDDDEAGPSGTQESP